MAPKRTKQKKRAIGREPPVLASPHVKKQRYSPVPKADSKEALPTPPSTASPTPETSIIASAVPSASQATPSLPSSTPRSNSSIGSDSKSPLPSTKTRAQAQAAKNLIRTPPPTERKLAERKQMEQKRLQPWFLNGKKHLKLWGLIYDDAVEQEENFWEDFGGLIDGVGTEGGGVCG